MTAGIGNCPDDRIAFARRGAIAPTEWDAFMAHVRVCGDCSAAWTAARSFEKVGGAQPEDEHLVRRAVQAALEKHSPRRRLTRHPMFVAAASVLLAGAVASAGMMAYKELRQPPAATPSVQRAPVPPKSHHRRRPGAHGFASPAEESAPEELPADESPAPADETAAPAVAPDVAPADVDAVRPPHAFEHAPANASARRSALFARATAARGAGRSKEAVTLFLRLQREFPGTPEATVSLVSLGELQIAASRPQSALDSFNRYLRQAPSGPLVPEALAAKARALDQLGRADQAEDARRELRHRIPEWPYVTSPHIGGKPAAKP